MGGGEIVLILLWGGDRGLLEAGKGGFIVVGVYGNIGLQGEGDWDGWVG